MGDHNTGSTFAGGICAARFHRERTGAGQLASTSLYRQGVSTVSFDLNTVLGWGRYTAIGTGETMGSPSINNYAAGDGRHFWIVGLEGERHWPPIARLAGHTEWLDDPRFRTPLDRARNAAELTALLDEAFATKPLDEWAPLFDAEPDMFWSRVQDPYEVVNDPTLHAAGGIVDVPDGVATMPMIATPVDFHGTPWSPRGMAPEVRPLTREQRPERSSSHDPMGHRLAAAARPSLAS
jgi:crotonobetainyl-CoA:carnitine CoA-transferase CaiB-like acyl-CoA transferase